ncbi:MAG: AmpG family muropeptide MFS transporter, partial [Candidatus Nitrotoga sp.]
MSVIAQLFTRRMLICIFTGFSSGLPLYLLFNLLPAWLRSEQIDLKTIGLFALIQFPYTWKFLWSPLLDRYVLPILGRRRGWMLLTQIGLLAVIASMGAFSPQSDLHTIAYIATLLAFLSATQDIVLDAYRRELLEESELGLGNAVHVNAYRIAGLVPGSLSLILADFMPWSIVFIITALFMLPGMVMTLMVKEPLNINSPRSLRDAVVEPFREFIARQGWKSALLILTFLFFYKLGDSMCTALATPFYMDMGFSKTQIGLIAKNAGLWPAVIGGLLGGLWMVKIGINRALWLFGVVQVVSIFGFFWLASVGYHAEITTVELTQLAIVIGIEALGVGLGTAAFVAFIARTTHPAYTATQFALFTSLAAMPRTFANAATGWLV